MNIYKILATVIIIIDLTIIISQLADLTHSQRLIIKQGKRLEQIFLNCEIDMPEDMEKTFDESFNQTFKLTPVEEIKIP